MLESTLQRLARIVAADQDLVVEIHGTSAYALPGKVVLPSLDLWGTDIDERLILGVLDHEVGHAVHTDFEVFGTIEDPKKRFILNLVEDSYIESLVGRRRSARGNLKFMHSYFWENGTPPDGTRLQDGIQEGADGAEWLTLNAIIAPFGGPTLQDVIDLSPPPEWVSFLEQAVPIATSYSDQSQDTASNLAIVEQLLDLHASIFTDEEDTEEDTDEQEQQQGQSLPGPSPRMGLEQFFETVLGQVPTGAARAALEDDHDKPKRPTMPWNFVLDNTPSPTMQPSLPASQAVVETFDLYDKSTARPYQNYDLKFDVETTVQGDPEAYVRLQAKAASATSNLVLAFESAFRASEKTQWTPASEMTPFLDTTALGAFSVGARPVDSIWMEKSKTETKKVVVSVLIDSSGSMGNSYNENSPSGVAKVCGVAMHEALKRVQIAHEVLGFTTSDAYDFAECERQQTAFKEQAAADAQAGTDFGRFARVTEGYATLPVYPCFKSFEDTSAMGLTELSGYCTNLDGEAVLYAARRLAKRPERRRILFVLSDGHPAGSNYGADGSVFLKDSVDRVIDAGIEVYALGIQSRAVEQYYPTWWVCNDLDDLSALAMGALTQAVVRQRTEREWVKL